ncbi:MAG: hypothetical protein M3Z50_02415 [Actinomycetota bacterium]|nr:hypothetical protein [Actinomycetota bacterium]
MTTHRSPARWGAAVLLVVVALVHLPLVPAHLKEAPYVGWLFIAFVVVCLALAVALVLADTSVAWLASGSVALAALVAFLVSRTVGLPQLGDDMGNWTDPLGYPAMASEALMTGLAALILIRRRTSASGTAHHLGSNQ